MPTTQPPLLLSDPAVCLIEKLKRPAGSGRRPGYHVYTDQNGVWLFTPAGSEVDWRLLDPLGLLRHQSKPSHNYHEAEGGNSLTLIPNTGWWVATWIEHSDRPISIDITTPAQIGNQYGKTTYSYTDLEVDVYINPFGQITTEDMDEFLTAQAAGHLSATEAAHANSTVTEIRELLQSAEASGPFGLRGRAILTASIARNLEPLDARGNPFIMPL